MIRLELTMPPTLNNLFPTGKSGGRFRSREYERWLKDSETALWLTKFTPIAGPVEIAVRYEDAGRRDIDNYFKAIGDFCVKHKLIEGDHRSIVRKVTLEWDRRITGCVVEIKETRQ